jgi:hypothetical protein
MSDSLGFLSKMAAVSVANWDSAYNASGIAGIPFTSESFAVNYERIQIDSLIGAGGREPSEQGNQAIEGTTEHELDFDNFELLFEAGFGALGGGTFTIVDRLAEYLFLEFEKETARYRVGAAKCTKFTISGEKGGLIKCAFDWLAKDFDDNATAWQAGATISSSLKARFLDVDFWLGDQVDALAAGDRFAIDSFEFTFDRGLKGDDYVSTGTAATAKLPIDPVEGARHTATFSMSMPRKSADTIVAWKQADTALQGRLEIARAGTGGGSYTLEMAHLVIPDGFDSPISGDAPLTIEGNFEVSRTNNGSHPMSHDEIEMDYTT